MHNKTPSQNGTEFGAEDGTRTHDLLITNQLLYQLSHSSILNTRYYTNNSYCSQAKIVHIINKKEKVTIMGLEINMRITECRKKAKMSKKEVAARLGKKYTTYCRMEEKAKRLTNAELESIAEVLGADVNYILYGDKKIEEDIFVTTGPLEPTVLWAKTSQEIVEQFDYTSNPKLSYSDDEFCCTSEERAMIRKYRGLSWEKKQTVRDFFNNL